MSTDITTGSLREKPDSALGRILLEFRRSFFLSLSVFGLFLILLGATVFTGVLAGMFAIWGGTAFLIGSIVYVITLLLRE